MRIKQKILHQIQKDAFSPSFLGVFTNPFYLCRKALYQALCELGSRLTGNVLDFGCGSAPYKELLTQASSYVGLEYDSPQNRLSKKADIFYDGVTIPLGDASVQGILSTQTLEHVPNPQTIVSEWARILAPGGHLLMTVPFMWPEHEVPYDFQRYSSMGLIKLLEDAGFTILEHRKLLNDCRAPAQLFLAWLYDSICFGQRSLKVQLIMSIFIFAPVALIAMILARLLPRTPHTYLDNIILAKR